MLRKKRWVLFLDLDGTMWDHEDISTLTPPFKKIEKNIIVDEDGVEVKLFDEMLDLIIWAKNNNGIVSSLSWNIPAIAKRALIAFEIYDLFDHHIIEPHPRKDLMIHKLLWQLKTRENINIQPKNVFYIDDRDLHIGDIYENIGNINFYKAWVDFKNTIELKDYIRKTLTQALVEGKND